ncbi:MAG: hypothetical protein DRP65_12150 [Planctomycetota bacterium]|nr:MAG: hypothetical protein DRP65_12150 [Planctomycetota bacterium]
MISTNFFRLTDSSKKWFLFLGAVLVICLRDYHLLTDARFWAEEGKLYFAYAFSHSIWETLFKAHLGYYSLFNNISMILAAKTVPLEYASLVATLCALLIQLIPIMIIIWGKSLYWDTLHKKTVVILLILFISFTDEVWLNTIASQFHFSLIAFLILCDESKGRIVRNIIYGFLLLLSGLTGPVSCFLTPLYIYKAIKFRNWRNIFYSTIMIVCAVIQFCVILKYFNSDIKTARGSWPEPALLGAILFNKSFLALFLGYTTKVSDLLRSLYTTNYLLFCIVGYSLFLFFGWFLFNIAKRLKSEARVYFLGSFLALAVLSSLSAVGHKTILLSIDNGRRYFYAPNIIFLTTFLLISSEVKDRFSKALGVLLVIGIITGGILYIRTIELKKEWPSWRSEVKKYREDSLYKPKIWPDGWEVALETNPESVKD